MSTLLDRLGSASFLSPSELDGLIRSAPRRYKVYEIKKKRPGEFRTIAQPAREVKVLQRWVVEHYLKSLPVHDAATGYRQRRNIADNARIHAGNSYLLKMDFVEFFPSIRANDLIRHLKALEHPPPKEDINALAKILFWRPKGTRELRLSIGAPSSPLLSNILMHAFDSKLAVHCDKLNVAYTRYADDLALSSNDSSSLRDVERYIEGLCNSQRSPKVSINRAKTVRVSKKYSRRVTGLVLANDGKISLGRDRKRQLRSLVYRFKLGELDPAACLTLQGMLAFANSVEPAFLAVLRRKYGDDTVNRVQHQFNGL